MNINRAKTAKTILFLCAMCVTSSIPANIVLEKPSVEELTHVKELMRSVWFDTYTKFYSKETVEKVTTYLQTLEYLRYQLENPEGFFLVAKDGKAVVGVITAQRESEVVQIVRLYVHYRSQFIGARLLGALFNYYGPTEAFRLEVKKDNLRARAFYTKFGFDEVGEENQTFFEETAVNKILLRKLKPTL